MYRASLFSRKVYILKIISSIRYSTDIDFYKIDTKKRNFSIYTKYTQISTVELHFPAIVSRTKALSLSSFDCGINILLFPSERSRPPTQTPKIEHLQILLRHSLHRPLHLTRLYTFSLSLTRQIDDPLQFELAYHLTVDACI